MVREYDTTYDKLGGRTDVNDHFRVPEADLELVVDRYYPDMRFEEVLADDNPAPNPALDLRVVGMGGEVSEPLFARGGRAARGAGGSDDLPLRRGDRRRHAGAGAGKAGRR